MKGGERWGRGKKRRVGFSGGRGGDKIQTEVRMGKKDGRCDGGVTKIQSERMSFGTSPKSHRRSSLGKRHRLERPLKTEIQ